MRVRHLLRIGAASVCFILFAAGYACAEPEYFDAHNHFTGILPYYAYANLPAFIAGVGNGSQSVSLADRLALYRYLAGTWYPAQGAALGNRLFSPAQGQRFAFGARAALEVYAPRVAGSANDLDGVLERVLTATPWTEFDSAYAFRGGPAYEYLLSRFYGGNAPHLDADLCRATILDLAQTDVHVSEQSLPFVGGWGFKDGRSAPLATIECALHANRDATVQAGLRAMDRPQPVVRFVLMTHTAQLATQPGGATYSEWSQTGACRDVALPLGLRTSPQTIENALLARDDAGRDLLPPARRAEFFAGVVGIDTAGPETTCFTPGGMAYYRELVTAVYDAAKRRRALGWHGKLLVHTHVGEGSVIDYAPDAPPPPWTFANAFSTFPSSRSNSAQAGINISILLAAIAQLERERPDLRDYVVFRMAHDTWANEAQAAAMHDQGVEADVNLESNVATGAYPLARAPAGEAALIHDDVAPLIADEDANFALNDLLGVLVRDPDDPLQTGYVLGNSSLRYLLEKHVRCLLGTDAAGVEHSGIVNEYRYAAALIAYWSQTDSDFRAMAPGVSQRTLFDDVRRHLADMASDRRLPDEGGGG